MKKHILLFFVIISSIFYSEFSFSQDPTFTQFYANPIYLNPAFAGSNGCPRIALNYRNQWPNLSANYVTYSASYDQYVKSLSGGIGVLASYDEQGVNTITTSTLGLVYSYHVKITRKFSVMFGAQASYYFKSLNTDKLTFGDMIDPKKGFIYSTMDFPAQQTGTINRSFFDASAGVLGYSKNFYVGFSAHHLNQPDETLINGDSKLPMRLTGHLGTDIPLGKKSKYESTTSISPNIIYQYQNGFQEINIGTYVKYNNFTAGVWYRNSDAFILLLGINTGTFKLGYSYDITISKLNNRVSSGSHEISLGLNLNCKSKGVTFKTLSCPSF
jgi:type IX secretion system PorP/SprF family membrane protein